MSLKRKSNTKKERISLENLLLQQELDSILIIQIKSIKISIFFRQIFWAYRHFMFLVFVTDMASLEEKWVTTSNWLYQML
jgi:hypothetical protein